MDEAFVIVQISNPELDAVCTAVENLTRARDRFLAGHSETVRVRSRSSGKGR